MLPNRISSETAITPAELKVSAQKIKDLRLSATASAVEIGRELLRVKEKLPHGIFVKWVERACEFKIRTAQDLMKLAREAETDAKLVALMVPSTLRVYLSKKTPPSVREAIRQRLENGERVSRSDLHSQIADIRAKAGAETGAPPAREGFSSSFLSPGLRGPVDGRRSDGGGDKARKVAELLLSRLSAEDYDQIMDGTSWEVWNRVFVWMRAARGAQTGEAEPALSSAPAPSLAIADMPSAKLQ